MTERNSSTPETALWAAVIMQAVREAGMPKIGPGARAWLQSRSEAIGSLRWICSQLDYDAGKIAILSRTREGRLRIMGRRASPVWGWGTENYRRGLG